MREEGAMAVADGRGHETGVPLAVQARLGASFRGLQRSGSAPPNLLDDDEEPLSPLSRISNAWSKNGNHQEAVANSGVGGWREAPPAEELSPDSKAELAAVSDPAYVQYYYAHKNINPRLPPPRTAGMTSAHGGARSALAHETRSDVNCEPQGPSMFSQNDPLYANMEKGRGREGGSRLQQETRSGLDPWSSEPGKGLMGLSPLSTKAGPGSKAWDSEYNMSASSPVFGHPSSPFAPVRTKPQEDAVDLLRSTALGIKSGRPLGLGGYGSAPGTPTKSAFESAPTHEGLSSLSPSQDDNGPLFPKRIRPKAMCSLASSLSQAALSAHVQQPNLSVGGETGQHGSQPNTPTMGGGYEPGIPGLGMRDSLSEHLERQQLEGGGAGQAHGGTTRFGSHAGSPAARSPVVTPPHMSPPHESPLSQQRSPARATMPPPHEHILPDNMYPGFGPLPGNNAGGGYAPMPPPSPPLPLPTAGMEALGGMEGFGFSSMPMGTHPMQQQMQAAMSMMYPFYAQQNAHAAALAHAALYGGGFGAAPPPSRPLRLFARATDATDAAPFDPTRGMPGVPREFAAYHQRMMEMYAVGVNGAPPNPASAMAAAAAAAAAANDPAAASMAAAAYAAATGGGTLPGSNMGGRGGKGSPEREPHEGDHHRRHKEGSGRKDGGGGRGGRRGDGHRRGADEDTGHASSLLEQLKCNKAKKIELTDIVGHVMEFCTDQHGSRFIQLKLESSTPAETAAVFDEVMDDVISLMTDVFGNYVVQKFLEHGSPEQREAIARALQNHVLSLSLQMYGCRVVQKALEVFGLERQQMVVAELEAQVMRCVRDQNGNHVIQKCIECVPTPHVAFMIDSFTGHVASLSSHPYGCRVIQRVLEHCSDAARLRSVMAEVLAATCQLAQDQYGNYVVQHVLERGASEDRTTVITQLAGQIVDMSQNKFASNVIEKCLQHGSHADRQILISEIIANNDENGPLQIMMKDQFGNYVVQKLLEVCDDAQREELLARIKASLHNLKKYTYGKHIVARVEKLVTNTQRLLRNSPRSPGGPPTTAQPPATVGGP